MKWPLNYGKSPFFMGKLTISMAMFNSFVKLPEGSFFLGFTQGWGQLSIEMEVLNAFFLDLPNDKRTKHL